MSDYKKSAAGSIEIVEGDFVKVEGAEAVKQDVEMMLSTWLTESVYDRNAGVPYLQIVFAEGSTDESIRFVISQRLLSLVGVAEVLSIELERDAVKRELTVTGEVQADSGETIPFSTVVS